MGSLEHFLFSHIFGIIIPIDFHIYQRGGSTTNQYQSWEPRNPMADHHRQIGYVAVTRFLDMFQPPWMIYKDDQLVRQTHLVFLSKIMGKTLNCMDLSEYVHQIFPGNSVQKHP